MSDQNSKVIYMSLLFSLKYLCLSYSLFFLFFFAFCVTFLISFPSFPCVFPPVSCYLSHSLSSSSLFFAFYLSPSSFLSLCVLVISLLSLSFLLSHYFLILLFSSSGSSSPYKAGPDLSSDSSSNTKLMIGGEH